LLASQRPQLLLRRITSVYSREAEIREKERQTLLYLLPPLYSFLPALSRLPTVVGWAYYPTRIRTLHKFKGTRVACFLFASSVGKSTIRMTGKTPSAA
jgi:hypothetical protein